MPHDLSLLQILNTNKISGALFFTGLLLDTDDYEVIHLPDIETKDVQLLHDCLLKAVPEDFEFERLSHLFNLFRIQFETFLDAPSSGNNK